MIDGASCIVQYFMNGYRLQWNTNGKAAVQLVTLTADD